MANIKISELTAITGANTAADDEFVIVDTSATETKKITRAELAAAIGAGVVDSVNGQTGDVVLDADDIADAATTNKFTTAADISKLAGIEASADVTDTTNVTAAGALMDSEVTNLAQVKAFDSSDYATAAQGTTADAALPKAGGAMTGAITTNSTFDGRDVATDGTKLDGIEASADVTDATNVAAAGAAMLTGATFTGDVIYQVAINAQTGTTYTTVLADQSKLVTLTNGSAITLTIPANSSVAYPVGTKIDFAQLGAGQVTFAGAGGVTVNATPTLKLRAQYSAASCVKTATDTWLLVGDLEA